MVWNCWTGALAHFLSPDRGIGGLLQFGTEISMWFSLAKSPKRALLVIVLKLGGLERNEPFSS
jgi:hypothetical protein